MDVDELSSRLQGQQRLIILHRSAGQWQTSARGADWDFSSGSARLRILQEVETTSSPVLVMDAHKDERFLSCPTAPFRSALCCPVVHSGSLVALVFIEDASPRTLSFEQLDTWSTLSRQMADRFAPPSSPRVTSKLLLGAAAVVALLGLPLLFSGRTQAPPKAAKTLTNSRQSATASTVAESYLAALRNGNLPAAYPLLSSPLQHKWNEASFIQQAQGWLAASDRAWGLKYRQVQVLRAGPNHCRVQVVPQGQASKQEVWTWGLVKEANGWRLENPFS